MNPRHLVSALLCAAFAFTGIAVIGQEGPTHDDSSTVARPRKKTPDAAPEPEKIPSEYNKKDKAVDENSSSFKVESNVVNLDVAVLDNKGHFIPNIPRGNFRVLEDNVPQRITNFGTGEAPMTVALVIEFSNLFQRYWSEPWYQTLMAAYGFVQTLKPEDYVAVVAYDLRPEILSDFSTDRMKTQEALQRLRIAGFSEANVFDALIDTCDRMSSIEGRKAVVLISSGMDTFSKHTFDQTRKKLQEDGVPIYVLGLMQALREIMDARGAMGAIQHMDFLQADNEMKTFSKETGGIAFFPRFYGEYPTIFQAISQSLRNQYSLAYQPTNAAKDGKFRKIKVELINPATNEPLPIKDEKGKPIKYQIVAKSGYKAPHEVE